LLAFCNLLLLVRGAPGDAPPVTRPRRRGPGTRVVRPPPHAPSAPPADEVAR